MKRLALLFALTLTGCATPGPDYGLAAQIQADEARRVQVYDEELQAYEGMVKEQLTAGRITKAEMDSLVADKRSSFVERWSREQAIEQARQQDVDLYLRDAESRQIRNGVDYMINRGFNPYRY